nr:ribonuclease H-like domain-containing protein [Tanacetum cinerariifolium]
TTRKDDEQSGRTVTITTKDMQRKKNDVKARTTLLLSLPDEHQAPRSHERGRKENYRQGSKAEEKTPKALMAIDGAHSYETRPFLKSSAVKTQYRAPWVPTVNRNNPPVNRKFSTGRRNFPTVNRKFPTTSRKYTTHSTKIHTADMGRKEKAVKPSACWVWNPSQNLSNKGPINNSVSVMFKKYTYIDTQGRLKELETLKLEKDGLDGKLAGLLKASKNLDNLIESQRSDKVKDGVGYNAVPPPPADLYLSHKKDLSWTGLPEFVDYIFTDYSRPSPTVASTSAKGQNKNFTTSEDVASPNTPKPFVKFIKPKDSQSERKGYKGRQLGSHRSAGHRPHSASMRPSYRPAGHRPHGPSINPMRPNMNGTRPNRSFFIQAHSYNTRPFLKSSAVKTQYRAPWVPTVNRNNSPVNRKFSTSRRNFPTVNRKFPTASRKFTTGSIKIHTADMGRKGKAVKPSACWIWKPTQNLSNKAPNNNSVSVMAVLKTTLMTKAIGTVAALECIVLGRNFKLLDDANILLRTPRQHNMYSIDLNNIVPHKDLTCLVTKASADECILWHRRLT